MSQPNYSIYIQKDVNFLRGELVNALSFCVIDLTKPAYPLNFVGKLQGINKEFELNLLKEALLNPNYSSDPVIKAAIDKRIRKLTPKPILTIFCKGCRQAFQSERKRGFCSSCRDRYYSKFQRACTLCGKTFNAYKNSVCPECRKEHNSSLKYRAKPQLGFVSKSVRELLNDQ